MKYLGFLKNYNKKAPTADSIKGSINSSLIFTCKTSLLRALIVVFVSFSLLHCSREVDCVCTEEYNPVCAGDTQYRNPCLAKCDGHKESEITILLTQELIDTGILVSVDCSL